jgi:uncharacterized protein YjcR
MRPRFPTSREKSEALRRIAAGERQVDVARALGVRLATVHAWRKELPEPRRSYRRAGDPLVTAALAAVAAGTPRQRVARQLGVAVETVRYWVRRAAPLP